MMPSMIRDLKDRAARFFVVVLPYRWFLMAVVGTAVIIFEIIEHTLDIRPSPGQLWLEILLYGLLLPLVGGAILTAVAHLDLKHNQIALHWDMAKDLSHEMSLAHNWESLKKVLLSFPLKVAPFSAVFLLLYDQSQHLLQTAGTLLAENGGAFTYPTQFLAPDLSLLHQPHNLNALTANHYPYVHWPETVQGFCLRLFHGNMLVAVLHLFLPLKYQLSEEQKAILNSLAAPMAVATNGLHPQGSALVRATAAELENRRLTRYLHDMIGQNVGYLVMQLDQMQMQEGLADYPNLKQQLAYLHGTANQIYDQIRVILTTWQPLESVDLMTAVSDQALLSSNQEVLFGVEVTSNGRSRPLPAYLTRKILGISREAIMNVRKHAQAHLLCIHLDWTDNQLTLTLQDDGQGFDVETDSHDNTSYGLTIMQERAVEINGRLLIQSQPNQGTTVTLILPLPIIDK
ncbi:MAG: hypothetical protein H6658_12070 [Ardenticatenaceae bacterium]|nr:hypothetical protein [Ardenticatenaceae bacterium]